MKLDVVGHTSNASILAAKTEDFLWVLGQFELHTDIKLEPSQNNNKLFPSEILTFCCSLLWL